VGFGVGAVQGGVLRASRWIAPLTAIVATGIGVVLFALVGAMLGQTQLLSPGPRGLLRIAGIVALMNGVGSLPVVALARWALFDPTDRRVMAR
jgi:hypothetical protein